MTAEQLNFLRRSLDRFIDAHIDDPAHAVAVDQACALAQTLAGGSDDDTSELPVDPAPFVHA